MFTFDVTSAYTHTSEDEFVFLEPPPEEIEEHGDCEVDQSDIWTSQGCKIVAGALLIPSSEVRKHGSEISQWNHIQSVRHSTTCARQMSD